jgi:hypothetical protein
MGAAEFFRGEPDALIIHRAVEAAVASIGGAEARVSKSQVGFYRRHPFAATWKPSQYLAGDRCLERLSPGTRQLVALERGRGALQGPLHLPYRALVGEGCR